MASPFGPKATATAEADDLLMITRGTGASLEVEKIDPRAAATGVLIALGLDATLGSTAWRTGGGGGGGFSILNGASDPAIGVGSDGDFYIQTTSWTIFGPKASGAWPSGVSLIGSKGDDGDPGSAGADGTDGADGATILTGSGVPSGGTGDNGDVYFDTTAKALYGPKASGAWGSGVALAGTDGSDGADGDDGAEIELQTSATHIQWRYLGAGSWTDLIALASITGAYGEDGAPGADGDDGADGMNGVPLSAVTQQAGTTYTFDIDDQDGMVEFTNASAITATIPPNGSVAYPLGATLNFAQDGAGALTLAAGSGVTFKYSALHTLTLAGQHAVGTAAKVATNTWRIFGNFEAA